MRCPTLLRLAVVLLCLTLATGAAPAERLRRGARGPRARRVVGSRTGGSAVEVTGGRRLGDEPLGLSRRVDDRRLQGEKYLASERVRFRRERSLRDDLETVERERRGRTQLQMIEEVRRRDERRSKKDFDILFR